MKKLALVLSLALASTNAQAFEVSAGAFSVESDYSKGNGVALSIGGDDVFFMLDVSNEVATTIPLTKASYYLASFAYKFKVSPSLRVYPLFGLGSSHFNFEGTDELYGYSESSTDYLYGVGARYFVKNVFFDYTYKSISDKINTRFHSFTLGYRF